MSEITKLYENAEVKKQIPKICSSNELYCKGCKAHIENAMPYCKSAEYPPFTAEKQLALIIFLANREIRISPTYMSSGYYLNNLNKITSSRNVSTFENSLAQHINAIWQDLTKEEKQQVKGILE